MPSAGSVRLSSQDEAVSPTKGCSLPELNTPMAGILFGESPRWRDRQGAGAERRLALIGMPVGPGSY
jgi:hypothetical protein